ncbi:MAG: ferritin-like domain-containing protein [Chloroflexia bacterium]
MNHEEESNLGRRELLKGGLKLGVAGGLAALALGVGKGGGQVFAQATAPFKNDIDVLNYALTLEYFEAELYSTLIGLGKLQGKDLQYVTLFGKQEADHVTAIKTTVEKLGGTPVSKGSYNFAAAGPLNDRTQILTVLATVESVGVAAYLGAAPFITNKDILAAAASIMQVEGRHTSVIKGLVGQFPVPDAFGKSLTYDEVIAIVTPFFK